MDCMNYLAKCEDNQFELAIVDPPYGQNGSQMFINRKNSVRQKSGTELTVLQRAYIRSKWDRERPSLEFFRELRRVTSNQIIWGGNYFADLLPPSPAWIVWDKVNGTTVQSDCELAWTSFDRALRKVSIMWNGMQQGRTPDGKHSGDKRKNELRIHPTQKPVALYKWILLNYAKKGDKILDTHLGSGSSRIAAFDLDFEFVGIEKDSDYFAESMEWFTDHSRQRSLPL